MQFTDSDDFELPGDSAGVCGNAFEPGYDDDENFTLLPEGGDTGGRRGAGSLAQRRANAMEDDDLTDIALHFGER